MTRIRTSGRLPYRIVKFLNVIFFLYIRVFLAKDMFFVDSSLRTKTKLIFKLEDSVSIII